jgi:hypothetical protein
MALVFDMLTLAEAEEPFAVVVATAPVTANAMTKVRMKSFMVCLLPFWLLRMGCCG